MDDINWKLLCSYWRMESPHVIVSLAKKLASGRLTVAVQRIILEEILANDVSVKYPPDRAYKLRVLKAVVAAAEADSKDAQAEQSSTGFRPSARPNETDPDTGDVDAGVRCGIRRDSAQQPLAGRPIAGAAGVEPTTPGGDGSGTASGGQVECPDLKNTFQSAQGETGRQEQGEQVATSVPRIEPGGGGGDVDRDSEANADEDEGVLEELYSALCEAMVGPTFAPGEEPPGGPPPWCYRTYVHVVPPELQHSNPTQRTAVNARFAKEISACGRERPPGGGGQESARVGGSWGIITLRASLNMLQGSTGCHVWPASFSLAQILLSRPQLVEGRVCLELGSGSGLVGVCLARLPAGKVILTDGNRETLNNLEHNLRTNGVHVSPPPGAPSRGGDLNKSLSAMSNAELPGGKTSKTCPEAPSSKVTCQQLDWESVSDIDLEALQADVILGADLVYDPRVVPSLVRVLGGLLQRDTCSPNCTGSLHNSGESISHPVAYIASTLRNEATLDLFLVKAQEARLEVADVTGMTLSESLWVECDPYRQPVRLHRLYRKQAWQSDHST